MRANATAAYDDHERVAKFGEAVIGQKDSISCELFEDQSWFMFRKFKVVFPLSQHTFVVITQSRPSRQGCTPLVVSVSYNFFRRRATKIVYLDFSQSAPRHSSRHIEHTLLTS